MVAILNRSKSSALFRGRATHSHVFNGGLSTGVHSGRFPVDAPYRPICAFFCSQTIRVLKPAGFHRSDMKLPCLSARNIHPDSSPDIAGDSTPGRRKAYANHRVTRLPEAARSISSRHCQRTFGRAAPSADSKSRDPAGYSAALVRME